MTQYFFIAALCFGSASTSSQLDALAHDAVQWSKNGQVATVFVTLPPGQLKDFSEVDWQGWHAQTSLELFAERAGAKHVGGRRFELRVMVREGQGPYRDLRLVLPRVQSPPTKPGETAVVPRTQGASKRAGPVGAGGARAEGALSGKTVYVSQGHGFTALTDRWSTQRATTHEIIEDLVNAEAINTYLVHYLRNAGALVMTVRERDMNPNAVVIDNGHPGYREVGEGFYSASVPGFGMGEGPLLDNNNPFAMGSQRLLGPGYAASYARFIPNLPEAGWYWVYAAYQQSAEHPTDVLYRINHRAGSTDVLVDQRQHGQTWFPLGQFYFGAGESARRGSVQIFGSDDAPISVDAVRFGGGMGQIDRGFGTSGRPLWEEAARYYTQYLGAPPVVFDAREADNADDVVSRSRYAAWEHPIGEDAVFISWHSNAPSPARGTSTWVYGTNAPDGSYQFSGIQGSDDLAAQLHSAIIGGIQAHHDPTWLDRGIFSAWFGEINPDHNPEMPAALMEVAFHATQEDALFLQEPEFRNTLARSIAHGVIAYFAERDESLLVLPPEPPKHVSARGLVDGGISLRWQAGSTGPALGDLASRYAVELSYDGNSYFRHDVVMEPEVVITDWPSGRPLWARIVAINSAGESFPSATVGALASGEQAPILVVNGFERLDRTTLLREDLSQFGLGTVRRLNLERMNNFRYTVTHGENLARLGIPFDSADHGVVEDGDIDLSLYAGIDWYAGVQSSTDAIFTEDVMYALSGYMDGGGALFLSGSEIAWAMHYLGNSEEVLFLEYYFGVGFGSDDSGIYEVYGEGTASDIAGVTYDDGNGDIYAVIYPDVFALDDLSPGTTQTVLSYGAEMPAGVYHEDTHRAFILGFPYETILSDNARLDVMALVWSLLLPDMQPVEFPADDGGPGWEDDGEPLDDGWSLGLDDGGDPAEFPDDNDGNLWGGDADLPRPPGKARGCPCSAGGGADMALWLLGVMAYWRRRKRTRSVGKN